MSNMRWVADSFYVPLGDGRWLATEHTTGPWDPGAQHGGPPSALLGRAMQECEFRPEMMISRFTCEILRPVPVGEVAVAARVVRTGRSVELLEASLSADGREVARASAWRVLRTEGGPVQSRQPVPDGPPEAFEPMRRPRSWGDGTLAAIEWRPVRGGWYDAGPAVLWTRVRFPLVAGTELTPLERTLIAADCANGVSYQMDIKRWHFINPELTVHLHREAVGEWVCLDASTAISPGGTGLASSALSDTVGPLGVGAQSLLIAPRP